jgi:hypothetical protein
VHGRVGEQHLLDLAGVDVLPATDDHVLEPPGNGEVAAAVEDAEVPGVEPAVAVDGLGGAFGHVEVAEHGLVAAGADLARLPDRHGLAGERVADGDLDVGQRAAGGCGLVLGGVVRTDLSHHGRQLCLAVDGGEPDAEAVLGTADELGWVWDAKTALATSDLQLPEADGDQPAARQATGHARYTTGTARVYIRPESVTAVPHRDRSQATARW